MSNSCSDCRYETIDLAGDLAGDVLSALFGEDAEGTAGVFGTEETKFEDADIEVVGAYAAYADNLKDALKILSLTKYS